MLIMINNPNTDEFVKELMEAGFPSAKIYTDTINSRSSNEVGIYGESSFAFLAGYLALNNREITNAPLVANDKNTGLRISAKNYSLFCSNCTGQTEVDLFSIDGRLLDKEVVQAFQPETKLVNYRRFLETFPIILYRVSDETGRIRKRKTHTSCPVSFQTGLTTSRNSVFGGPSPESLSPKILHNE